MLINLNILHSFNYNSNESMVTKYKKDTPKYNFLSTIMNQLFYDTEKIIRPNLDKNRHISCYDNINKLDRVKLST